MVDRKMMPAGSDSLWSQPIPLGNSKVAVVEEQPNDSVDVHWLHQAPRLRQGFLDSAEYFSVRHGAPAGPSRGARSEDGNKGGQEKMRRDRISGGGEVPKNHLGNAAMATDTAGQVVMRATLDPYGNVEDMNGAWRTAYLFTGKENLPGLGLYYFGARWYDPELGMWLSRDPVGQFESPYVYTGNLTNSLRVIDAGGNVVIAPIEIQKQYPKLLAEMSPEARERIAVLEKSKLVFRLKIVPKKETAQEIVIGDEGQVLKNTPGSVKRGNIEPTSTGALIKFDGSSESLAHELGGHGTQIEKVSANLGAVQKNLGSTESNPANLFEDLYWKSPENCVTLEKDAFAISGMPFTPSDQKYYEGKFK